MSFVRTTVSAALVVAGLVFVPATPALADPHDHPCAFPVDANCSMGGFDCDVYVEIRLPGQTEKHCRHFGR